MKSLVRFFVYLNELRKKPRRGWLVHQIKKGETTAEHIFRVAIFSWLIGRQKPGLDQEKIIKMALVHDLCEVFSPDFTPYDPLLPKELNSLKAKKKIDEILQKWPQLSFSQKKQRTKEKFSQELKGIKKLVSFLPSQMKEDFFSLWLEFERGVSPEARLVKQIDKLENFLQGMEYSRKCSRIQTQLWRRWAEEVLSDPDLIKIKQAIERHFFMKKKQKKDQASHLIDLLIEAGKLKQMSRRGFVLIGMKNPPTVASHSFRVAIMSWIFAFKKRINQKRAIAIALFHDLCEVYAGDETPYDAILPKDRKKWNELFDRRPLLLQAQKRKIAEKKYRREFRSLKKLTKNLPLYLKEMIFCYWHDYKKGITKEARMVKQLNQLETLLQALEYAQEIKRAPFNSWLEATKQLVDDKTLLKFLEAIENYFAPVFRYRKQVIK